MLFNPRKEMKIESDLTVTVYLYPSQFWGYEVDTSTLDLCYVSNGCVVLTLTQSEFGRLFKVVAE